MKIKKILFKKENSLKKLVLFIKAGVSIIKKNKLEIIFIIINIFLLFILAQQKSLIKNKFNVYVKDINYLPLEAALPNNYNFKIDFINYVDKELYKDMKYYKIYVENYRNEFLYSESKKQEVKEMYRNFDNLINEVYFEQRNEFTGYERIKNYIRKFNEVVDEQGNDVFLEKLLIDF